MNYSLAGEQLTEQFEGCELTAYQDQVGVWTIGYGHTASVTPGQACTPEQAQEWLEQDTQWAVGVVNAHVNVPLTQGEFDSLVDFVFNLGAGNFESSTLLRLLNSGDYADAAAQFPRWDLAGGQVVAGLLRRRLAEQAEFNGGSNV